MNKYVFGTKRAPKSTEEVEGSGRAHRGLDRYRSLSQDKRFSLTIRSTDGCKLLETRVEHVHQAFQRLIDWSIDEIGQDVYAAVSGPNGFYTNHRIKASRDFGWIESKEAISETSEQVRS